MCLLLDIDFLGGRFFTLIFCTNCNLFYERILLRDYIYSLICSSLLPLTPATKGLALVVGEDFLA
jgi:hypothetical protein